jgi:hypothetical protein
MIECSTISAYQLKGSKNQSVIIGKLRKAVTWQGRYVDCTGPLRGGCTVARWPSYRPLQFIQCNAAPDYALTSCTVRIYPTHFPACPPQPQSILTLADSHLSLCLPRSVFIVMVSGYMQKHGENFRQSANYRSWHYGPQELSQTRTCRINKDLVVGFA